MCKEFTVAIEVTDSEQVIHIPTSVNECDCCKKDGFVVWVSGVGSECEDVLMCMNCIQTMVNVVNTNQYTESKDNEKVD